MEIADLLDLTPDAAPGDLVTSAELADWLGLSSGRVNQMARDGLLPRETLPGGYGFPLKAAVRAYAEHARAAAARRAADPELAAEKLRLTKANADRAEQAAARDRGDLLDATEVAKAWTATLTDLRAALLAIPERVSARLGLDRSAATALDGELRAALEVIADDR